MLWPFIFYNKAVTGKSFLSVCSILTESKLRDPVSGKAALNLMIVIEQLLSYCDSISFVVIRFPNAN